MTVLQAGVVRLFGKRRPMKTGRVLFLIVMWLIPSAVTGRQSAGSGDVQLKAAMHAELVEGDLRAAIEAYKAIVSRYGDNRALVARALLQLGGCYEKLGQAEARKTYEQLVRDYADQSEPAVQARARLAALGRPQPPAAPSPVVTALPRADFVNDVQAVSPDGTKALFISYDKGMNLGLYDFATRQKKLLTEFEWNKNWVDFGAWSPDGRRVAYMQSGWAPDAVAEVRVATLSGDSRVIFRNEANPGRRVSPAAWLPDGRSLLAVLELADGTIAIGLIPAAGGPFTPLRSLAWPRSDPRPRVSPDGRFVAFSEGAAGTHDIQVLKLEGRTVYRITDHPADDVQPLWSPDGGHIVFISTRFGQTALWSVAVKDGQAVGEAGRVRDGMQGVELIDWTTRGLMYVDHLQTQDIYTVPVDHASWQPTAAPRLLPYPRTGRNSGPVWSPDGRYLAFVSGSFAEPDRRYVVVLPEGGGDPREYLIPTNSRSPEGPYDLRWFGDGSGLGFSGSNRQGQPTIFHLSLATGQWETYASPVQTWTRIEWNNDGTKYFYGRQSVDGKPLRIVERDLKTDGERAVYTPNDARGALRGLRLSPDRRSLAFTLTSAAAGPALRLMVVDAETGRARTLMEEKSGTTLETTVSLGVPAWSPDGRALIVPRTVGQNMSEFRVVPLDDRDTRSFVLDGAFTRQVTAGGGDAPQVRDVMWSPDGTRMTFVLLAFRADTWMIENVLAGARPAADIPRQ
jgi:Tol biopolymer transport system component